MITYKIKKIKVKYYESPWWEFTAYYNGKSFYTDSIHKNEDGFYWASATPHEWKRLGDIKEVLIQCADRVFSKLTI